MGMTQHFLRVDNHPNTEQGLGSTRLRAEGKAVQQGESRQDVQERKIRANKVSAKHFKALKFLTKDNRPAQNRHQATQKKEKQPFEFRIHLRQNRLDSGQRTYSALHPRPLTCPTRTCLMPIQRKSIETMARSVSYVTNAR